MVGSDDCSRVTDVVRRKGSEEGGQDGHLVHYSGMVLQTSTEDEVGNKRQCNYSDHLKTLDFMSLH